MTTHSPDPSGQEGASLSFHGPRRISGSARPKISRRTALATGATVAAAVLANLVACAAQPDTAKLPESKRPTATSPGEEPVVADPPPQAPAQPDHEAIIAAHEGQQPVQWGTDIPGVVRQASDVGADPTKLYLTLDACGGPAGSGIDQPLIDGLRATGIPALLFVNHRWITAHPAFAAELAQDPLFTLGNHGTTHSPLSVNGASAYGIPGTATVRDAVTEVWHNHVALTELTGKPPTWFRPGTAHLDNVALSIVHALGERVLGFNVNGDAGATFPAGTVTAEIGNAAPGSVIIGHFNQPASATAAGVLAAIPLVAQRGLQFGVL